MEDAVIDDLENVFHGEDASHQYVNPDPDASKPVEKFDYAETIVSSFEDEFRNIPNAAAERRKHKEELTKKLADLTKKLKNTKNIKNHKMRAQNAVIAERRKKLREEIESVKDDLFAITQEESGENISSTSLVDATVSEAAGKEKLPSKNPQNPASFITANNSNLFGGSVSSFPPETSLKF